MSTDIILDTQHKENSLGILTESAHAGRLMVAPVLVQIPPKASGASKGWKAV